MTITREEKEYHLRTANGFIGEAIFELDAIHAYGAVNRLKSVRAEIVDLLDMFDIEKEQE